MAGLPTGLLQMEESSDEAFRQAKLDASTAITKQHEEAKEKLAVLFTEPTDQNYRSTIDSIMAIHREWKIFYPVVRDNAMKAGAQKRNMEVMHWALRGDDIIQKEDILQMLSNEASPSSKTSSMSPGSALSDTESSLSCSYLKDEEAIIELKETDMSNLMIVKFGSAVDRCQATAPPPNVYTRRFPIRNFEESGSSVEMVNIEPTQGPSRSIAWDSDSYSDEYEMHSVLVHREESEALDFGNQQGGGNLTAQLEHESEESAMSDIAQMSDITQQDVTMQSMESIQCDDSSNLPDDNQPE